MSVYFARVGRYIKIGYSARPERRVRNLNAGNTRYAAPIDCDMSDRQMLRHIEGDLNCERACHAALDNFAAGGEFFIDEPPVRDFIAAAESWRTDYPIVFRADGEFGPPKRPLTAGELETIANIFRLEAITASVLARRASA